jgi:hypothetical protein
MVSGPAGMRCPECASLRGTHLYKIEPWQLALQALIGIIAGAVGVAIVNLGSWIFFVIFLSTAYGGAAGELMLRVNGRKQGNLVQLTAVISMVAGGLGPVIYEVVAYHTFAIVLADWLDFVALGIASAACYSRVKYF